MDFIHYSFKHYSHADACRNDLVAAGFNTCIMECADDDGRTVHSVHAYFKDYDDFEKIKAIARPHDLAEIARNKPTPSRVW